MSLTQMEEIKCRCGAGFVSELWGTVNVASDPDLKDAVLGGELNVVQCPKCGSVFYVEKFILYHDPHVELMAFVYPEHFSSSVKEWHEKMTKQFEDVQNEFAPAERLKYGPTLVFGMSALCDIIRRDEELEDESKVVEYECRAKKIPFLRLRPSVARAFAAPRVIPSPLSGRASKSGAMSTMQNLIAANPSLTRCAKFLETVAGVTDEEFESRFAGG